MKKATLFSFSVLVLTAGVSQAANQYGDNTVNCQLKSGSTNVVLVSMTRENGTTAKSAYPFINAYESEQAMKAVQNEIDISACTRGDFVPAETLIQGKADFVKVIPAHFKGVERASNETFDSIRECEEYRYNQASMSVRLKAKNAQYRGSIR